MGKSEKNSELFGPAPLEFFKKVNQKLNQKLKFGQSHKSLNLKLEKDSCFDLNSYRSEKSGKKRVCFDFGFRDFDFQFCAFLSYSAAKKLQQLLEKT